MNMQGVAFITGAGSGIGRETAYQFAEKGAAGVVFADINESPVREAATTSKKFATNPDYKPLALRIDVTDKSSVEQVVETVVKEFGRIDYAAHCAGVGPSTDKAVSDFDLEEFKRVHDVNATGLLLCTAAVARVMQAQSESFVEGRSGRRSVGRGAIVNIASLAALMPIPTNVQYCSSKYAAKGITDVAAVEYSRKGVRINCLCPGWANTPMMEKNIARAPESGEAIANMCPVGRMATVEEVAAAIPFLCSPDASYIIGVGLVVDAGFSVGRGLN